MKSFTRVLAVIVALWTPGALAHSLSASYLTVNATTDRAKLAGRWEISLTDLQMLLDLDVNGDGAVTWAEVKARFDRIATVALPGLKLERGAARCPARLSALSLNERSDGYYAVLDFVAACAASRGELSVGEHLFFERDRTHRTVLAVHAGERHSAAVLTPDAQAWRGRASETGALHVLREFLIEGVWHIWIGYDHLAFLLLLLLPVVLRGEGGRWSSAESGRAVLASALRIVTAFTVAHSITLSLAALGIVAPPDKPVEMAIAASVAVAGVLNLFPAAARLSVGIAFGFGLVHGFGFAGALGDLGLEHGSIAMPLAGFNLGVEAGQLTIVAAVLPLLYALRFSALYRRRLVPATSIVVGLLAIGWLIERAG
ncbi:MAG TPA: HupE/UreJ family protein [Steroidobacteraceae bacterium]|nr:HupE/UreJ family protein [Steroidobacteraceae bacterium]